MAESESLKRLRRLGVRIAKEGERVQSTINEQAALLQEAGLSALALAAIIEARTGGDPEGFGLDFLSNPDDPEPEPIVINGNCVVTCVMSTIELTIKVKCKNSIGMMMT